VDKNPVPVRPPGVLGLKARSKAMATSEGEGGELRSAAERLRSAAERARGELDRRMREEHERLEREITALQAAAERGAAEASSRHAIEIAPSPRTQGVARGVVATGAVGSRLLRGLRMFRYEVCCRPDGLIPDLAAAVGGPYSAERLSLSCA